ncbi:uncharacterized protein LOC130495750 [Raphanus sativus]|uniref:Uncharacterized protein LOC130495750 n=1 Tax=Raphanus sativus TaxID=3726 RepID=A0A9W3BVL3_RAPSA|nr:uncharacterized protein LOC130495750 [Raphanus sativus]
MALDDDTNQAEMTPREIELLNRLEILQSQVTDLHKARETTPGGHELLLEVQTLKDQLGEHSKQLLQSAEKLDAMEAENLVLRQENQTLGKTNNKRKRFRTKVRPMASLNTPRDGERTSHRPITTDDKPEGREAAHNATRVQVDSDSDTEDEEYSPDDPAILHPSLAAYLERVVSERFGTIQSMVERLPGVAPPIRRSNPGSYSDTPFVEEIASVEMPRKFSFPSIKMYEGTGDPDNHVAQYKQRILAVAIPREAQEATMCIGFGSTLTGPALQWYINLPTKSIRSFAALSDKFVEQFASSRNLEKNSDDLYEVLQHRNEPLRSYIARFKQEKVAIPECNVNTAMSAFKRGLLPEGDLYKELTKYKCRTMEDVLSRTWAQVRWEEDVASRAKAYPKHDQKSSKLTRNDCDESFHPKSARETSIPGRGRYQNRPLPRSEGMMVSNWPDISHLAITKPELIGVLRQMGPQVKWTPKMKASVANRNPKRWCEFHSDHGHTTEDCIALKIEVAELLKKGHLREFLSDKATNLLNKEGPGLPTEAAPALPPQQDRVIHVISGVSEVSGISRADAKRSTRNARNGQEAEGPKRLLLGKDDISFTAREQERVLAPHHDALVISLTIANCLVKQILVDNGSSSNIIFHSAYADLGLEPKALTRKATPFVGFS